MTKQSVCFDANQTLIWVFGAYDHGNTQSAAYVIDFVTGAVIVAAGLYLIALGISCFVSPRVAATFLLGHASSGFLHYLELTLRVLLGVCLVLKAAALPNLTAFKLFGWVLIATTTVLFLIPWHWHHQFTLRAVPYALRYVKLLGTSSIALGGALIGCVAVASIA